MPSRPTPPRRWTPRRPSLEWLEVRSLPSATAWPGLAAPHVDAAGCTLGAAYHFLTPLAPGVREEAVGLISNSASGGGNADWYEFDLPAAADVTIATPPGQGAHLLTPALSLFNAVPTNDDPYTPDGHRLLAQDDGATGGGVATIDMVLAPGTYYVAVSGTGDHDFYPFLAGSGETGGTGAYGLLITARALASPPAGPGPAVVATTPADGAVLYSSPFAIYVELSAAIDPGTLQAGVTVLLTGQTTGTVQLQQTGNGDPTDGVLFNDTGDGGGELVILPEAPLVPDTYQLQLSGYTNGGTSPVIETPDGTPLGATASAPDGQDFTLTFTVAGIKGQQETTTAFNTTASTLPLNVTPGGGLTQVRGAIGDDPFALNATGSWANDVDLYHFTITGGESHYAFLASAEAGRVGSPLQPALALFEYVNGRMTLIAGDMGTGSTTQAADGSKPLLNDAVMYAGLTPGDYYLAVGGAWNLPDPALGMGYSPGGGNYLFDPTVPYSALSAYPVPGATGPYVLTTSLTRDDAAPHVTAVGGLSTPGAPTTFITVHFDKPVTLRQLGYQDQPGDGTTVSAVWVQPSGGAPAIHPRLLSYDDATNTATFYLLDAVPSGPAQLILAATDADGNPGVTDLAGNWLAGSDPSGDYVIPFTVSAPPRGAQVTITRNHQAVVELIFTAQATATSLEHPQVIGPLFPDEMGVSAVGPPVNHEVDLNGFVAVAADGPTDTPLESYFQVQLLQDRNYGFNLVSPGALSLTVFTADGHEVPNFSHGPLYNLRLAPGTYVIRVGPAGASVLTPLAYQLRITLGTSFENAVALTVGAAPPYAIAPARTAPPTPPAAMPPTMLTLPAPPATTAVAASPVTVILPADGGTTLALPSGSLSSLSAPPVGGGATPANLTAPAAPDRLVLNDAPVSGGEGSLRFALLTEGDALPADFSTGAGRPGGLSGRAAELLRLIERLAIDLLFRSGSVDDWLHGFAIPQLPPDLAPPADAPGADQGPPADRRAPTAGAVTRPAADWAWAGGLLAVGGLAVVPSGARRRRDSRRTRAHEPGHRRR